MLTFQAGCRGVMLSNGFSVCQPRSGSYNSLCWEKQHSTTTCTSRTLKLYNILNIICQKTPRISALYHMKV